MSWNFSKTYDTTQLWKIDPNGEGEKFNELVSIVKWIYIFLCFDEIRMSFFNIVKHYHGSSSISLKGKCWIVALGKSVHLNNNQYIHPLTKNSSSTHTHYICVCHPCSPSSTNNHTRTVGEKWESCAGKSKFPQSAEKENPTSHMARENAESKLSP